MTDYERYVRSTWQAFLADRARYQARQAFLRAHDIRRVLDVGCGAGQELLPFAEGGAIAVGIDVSREAGAVGRALYRERDPALGPHFLCGRGEALPLRAGAFDLVLCRVALPYMHNRGALAEMARVLRAGGFLMLKVHHGRYYADKLWSGLTSGHARSAAHAARVLLAGSAYHLLGRQVFPGSFGREVFQSAGRLRRELVDMRLEGLLGEDTSRLTPAFLFVKSTSPAA